jgi:hypothetical protein
MISGMPRLETRLWSLTCNGAVTGPVALAYGISRGWWVNAEVAKCCVAGRRHPELAWPLGRFYPAVLPERGGKLGTELAAEVRPPSPAIHA